MQITRVDAAGDRLMLHYRTEVIISRDLAAVIQRFAQQQPASFAAFQTHYTNAQIISQGEVRTIDILTWMSKDIPPAVNTAMVKLQTYLHEEAFLRHDLAVLKLRELNTNDWTADHKYAVARHSRAKFGFETKGAGMATLALRHQDQGKHLLQYLRAGLDARVIRVNDASISSRYGAQNWHDSVEGKMDKWITAVVRYLNEQLHAAKLLATQFSQNVVPAGENATQLSLDKAKHALKLTNFTEDGEQFNSLIFAMKKQRDEMKHRQALLKGLIKCKTILESIEEEIKEAEDASDEGRLATLAARKKLKDDKADIYIAKIEYELGPRVGWDWVLG
ncbi:hypothetical protein LTR82_012843 [Friedmanniomyces endolithicus]|uniref:Uncharacterized protein n=1 Tax=Friedmanniomyces endolithicus TaxID=329885 RepID=A0AAN6FHE5_9PEZI|nr:hypothetical protein LTR82_012843 [Friedmanniomyces endolithicus]